MRPKTATRKAAINSSASAHSLAPLAQQSEPPAEAVASVKAVQQRTDAPPGAAKRPQTSVAARKPGKPRAASDVTGEVMASDVPPSTPSALPPLEAPSVPKRTRPPTRAGASPATPPVASAASSSASPATPQTASKTRQSLPSSLRQLVQEHAGDDTAAVPETPATRPSSVPVSQPSSDTPVSLAKFCHNCGVKYADGAKFCVECGVRRVGC